MQAPPSGNLLPVVKANLNFKAAGVKRLNVLAPFDGASMKDRLVGNCFEVFVSAPRRPRRWCTRSLVLASPRTNACPGGQIAERRLLPQVHRVGWQERRLVLAPRQVLKSRVVIVKLCANILYQGLG